MTTRYKEDVQKLFEFWCELEAPERHGIPGRLLGSFPDDFNDPELVRHISDFAYPCDLPSTTILTYSFVLTTIDSKWRFGFCRHDQRTRTAMVVLTYLPWNDVFTKFVNVLGELRASEHHDEFAQFLREAYVGIPEPGACLKLVYRAGTMNFMFQRPAQFMLPSIPENNNLNMYYNFVRPKHMIEIFAAMLSERRIVFTSDHLDRLSAAVQAANSLLYPMVWEHIFIPVLPMKMRDMLGAMIPFLIGVPTTVLKDMRQDELGEVVIVELDGDDCCFQSPFSDVKNMPPELVSQLKKNLSTNELVGNRVSKIFLGILVQLIGGYRDGIKFSQGEKFSWDGDLFLESKAPHIRSFLKQLMQSQMFQQFIDGRLQMLETGQGISDEFEMETIRYSERMMKKGKHYKDFLRNVKDKTNPAVKSAVQSVKQGSRGMKAAYKDLRSKMRDKPGSTHDFYDDGHMSHRQHNHHHFDPSEMAPGGGVQPAGRSSAPNSPVFRIKQSSLPPPDKSPYHHQNHHQHSHRSSYQNPKTSQNTFFGSTNQNQPQAPHSINNNHIKKSHPTPISGPPTSSQSSSNSSSEMNLLQELQQHALFRTPISQRSMKPSLSTENNSATLRPLRTGSLVNTPVHRSGGIAVDSISLQSLRIHDQSTAQHSFLYPVTSDASLSSVSPDSSFDSPPEMPSPPVPPRTVPPQRPPPPSSSSSSNHQTSFLSYASPLSQPPPRPNSSFSPNPTTTNHTSSQTSRFTTDATLAVASSHSAHPVYPASVPLPSPRTTVVHKHSARASSSGFESNFADVDPSHIAITPNPSSSSTPSSAANHPEPVAVASSSFVPLARPTAGPGSENSKSTADESPTSPNLITLDTSFELEDFDPLNKNAKTLPTVTPKPSQAIAAQLFAAPTKPTPSNGHQQPFNYMMGNSYNPVYPSTYLSSMAAQPQAPPRRKEIDADADLLRQYGLFSLLDSSATGATASAASNGCSVRNSRKDWTDFD